MGRRAKPKKGKAEAKRPLAGRSAKSEAPKVGDLEKRLTEALAVKTEALKREAEALEQQAATAEILRVISRSPADVQSVFDAIVDSAMRLFRAWSVNVCRFDGELVHLVATRGGPGEAGPSIRGRFPTAPTAGLTVGRCILDRAVIQIDDVEAEVGLVEATREMARARGWRSALAVPMLRDGEPIGALMVTRKAPGGFEAGSVELLQTFADQAVIAIENVRLFTELEARNREVTEALEQQTATSEILRVISRSPTDLRPVFDQIAYSAAVLCQAAGSVVFRFDGQELHVAAMHTPVPEFVTFFQTRFPMAPDRSSTAGRVILDGAVVHIANTIEDPEYGDPGVRREAQPRSALGVPMLREGRTIGTIVVGGGEGRRFSDKQVALLQTFADQAVIAIENVRLFTELQEKNEALTQAHAQVTESLEQQMATAEILRVISSSPTDVTPVLDRMAESATRFCLAYDATIWRLEGDHLVVVAHHGPLTAPVGHVTANMNGTVVGRSVLERQPVHIVDLQAESEEFPEGSASARRFGHRTTLSVPLLREGVPLGTITLRRGEVAPFTAKQIALLQTFADQAVIAIENVRLFTELQSRTAELTRSVGELRALGDVSQALSSTLDVDAVLDTIVTRANDLIGADSCTIFEYDEATDEFHLRVTRNLEPQLVELARGTPLGKGEGVLGTIANSRGAVQVRDITVGYRSPISAALIAAGYRSVVGVPLMREDHLIGALTMNRKSPGEFSRETIELLQTFATQSTLAIQNARLFREIEVKSRELQVASQHKSEFLANMSHELRTPLNAIIGYSELLEEEAGDLDGGRLVPDLQKIATAAKHQLSLINDILDLSKVEAGRMELELSEFNLPNAIENTLVLVRERASRRGIKLGSTIDERLGAISGDERKVKQVLLNVLANALKFTPEGGRIDVSAREHDGVAEVSVTDTGVGIAPEDQEAVFEEFRQVGTADKKVEGTGLGLALSRKFVELHGGRIWVRSQVGEGSTFTFTLPVRPEKKMGA